MSSLNTDRLYALLPAFYRIRDEQQGGPLRELVALIAHEFEALEENVEQLYDDQFIETCADWVAPYIGDLIGYRPLYGVAASVASPRAEVANTIAYRRRKGTAAMLEQLARDVTDWPARAVEFFEQLATTQYMNHVRLHAPATADLRSAAKMVQRGGPFNAIAHTAEMRRPEAGSGRYNITNIGLFLWRLQPWRLSNLPLTQDATDATGTKFRFNPLGADLQLFRLPLTERLISHIADPANVPDPLRVREIALQVRAAQHTSLVVSQTLDYGGGRSFELRRSGALVPINRSGSAVPTGTPTPPSIPELRIADLRDIVDLGGAVTGWAHEAVIQPNDIMVDPERGRVLLGNARATEHAADPFVASFHYGFSRPIGGGEYTRNLLGGLLANQQTVSQAAPLQPQLDAIASGGRLLINDSLTYTQMPVFKVNGTTAPGAPGLEVVVTARDGARPLIKLGGPILLAIGARGRLVLDGLVISGGSLQLAAAADNEPRELVLRHCTLVPGLSLNTDGSAASPGAPCLVVAHPFATVTLEQCIVGALKVVEDAEVSLVDCIIDAGSPQEVAFEGTVPGGPGAEMTIRDSTVIGKLHVRLMKLASNTLFFARGAATASWPAPVWVERKQEGCMRFCFVPNGSLVPLRFRCLPDDAHPDVLAHFTSLRYGDPGYAQLRGATNASIRQGADDGGEIGVMHPLHQPQREANLRIRLDEYLRFGLHAGIFYST
jgi:hypothetical protein